MTTMTTTLASSAPTRFDACTHCVWVPENDGLWPTFGRIAVRWIEKNLIFAEGDSFGKPVRLRRDQKAFLWKLYEYCPGCDWWHYRDRKSVV